MPWTWSSPTRTPPGSASCPGPTAEIERSRRDAAPTAGSRPGRVPVSAAFHSRFVAERPRAVPRGRSTRSRSGARRRSPSSPTRPAEPYPDDPEPARDLLAEPARPARSSSSRQIEAMYRMGRRTFLEVGPDAKLTGLVRSILEGRDHARARRRCARAGIRRQPPRSGLLARNLGRAGVCCRPRLGGMTGILREDVPATQTGADREDLRRQSADPAGDRGPPTRRRGTGASTPSPIASLAESTMPHRLQPRRSRRERPNDEPSRTAEFVTSSSSNGQASALEPRPPGGRASRIEPPTAATARGAIDRRLAAPSRTAQENLIALQRLAEQTAELHRQFLEGQEKTQQTFLKLLEQQQRLAASGRDAAAPLSRHPVAQPHRECDVHEPH